MAKNESKCSFSAYFPLRHFKNYDCTKKEYKNTGLCLGHYAQKLRGFELSPMGEYGPQPTEDPPHKILKEVLRNYTTFKTLLTDRGQDVLEHSYYVIDGEPGDPDEKIRKITLTVSFSDLQNCLKPQSDGGILSDRKREALLYNVVYDKLQKDVADMMGITPVSVGQYTELALRQLARRYFIPEDLAGSHYDYGILEEDE